MHVYKCLFKFKKFLIHVYDQKCLFYFLNVYFNCRDVKCPIQFRECLRKFSWEIWQLRCWWPRLLKDLLTAQVYSSWKIQSSIIYINTMKKTFYFHIDYHQASRNTKTLFTCKLGIWKMVVRDKSIIIKSRLHSIDIIDDHYIKNMFSIMMKIYLYSNI